MLDTINVSIPMYIEPSERTIDWEADVSDKGTAFIYKLVTLPNGATIYIRYYFTHSLTLSFSASRIQNGDNAIAYSFDKSNIVKKTILKVISDELGITNVKLSDFLVCRLDINRDFVCDNEKTANELAAFSNKILPLGYEKRFNYNTGLTSQTRKGRGFRVYRKDKDKKKRQDMNPTVRFEFQMDKKMVTNILGYRPNLNEILSRQVTIEKVWNNVLSIYALDKRILNRRELHKFSLQAKVLTPTEKETLKQMNDRPSFDDKEQRRWQLKVTHKLKARGICPYSCEVPIVLKVNVCTTILNLQRKKNRECTICKQHLLSTIITLRDTNKKVKKWYLDSS
ncbi:MAG: hypothetical protein J6J23_04830 [Clostridia bacterium]|nr:hypothetical protein [Clostridia bacterium]